MATLKPGVNPAATRQPQDYERTEPVSVYIGLSLDERDLVEAARLRERRPSIRNMVRAATIMHAETILGTTLEKHIKKLAEARGNAKP